MAGSVVGSDLGLFDRGECDVAGGTLEVLDLLQSSDVFRRGLFLLSGDNLTPGGRGGGISLSRWPAPESRGRSSSG